MPQTYKTSANKRLFYIRKTTRGGNKRREKSIQHAIVKILRRDFPEVSDFFNDWASGAYLSYGQSNERRLLSSGRGWADLFIPYPSRGYHGLFLELKKEGTRIYCKTGPRAGQLVKNEQIMIEAAFLERMNTLGYYACFASGTDEAVQVLNYYFNRPENLELF